MINTILLDIDGVCNRFVYHAFQHVGITDFTESDYPVQCGFDVVEAINTIAGEPRYFPSLFWDSLDRQFWATIPVSQEFTDLLMWAVNRVGKRNVYFLSATARSADSAAGKVEWIQKNAPYWLQRQYLLGPSKAICANESTLLIDDREKNVEEFVQAGGYAWLMPRPWNNMHGQNPRSVFEGK
jgi:5'(3')-deoxyribonucleotidase